MGLKKPKSKAWKRIKKFVDENESLIIGSYIESFKEVNKLKDGKEK